MHLKIKYLYVPWSLSTVLIIVRALGLVQVWLPVPVPNPNNIWFLFRSWHECGPGSGVGTGPGLNIFMVTVPDPVTKCCPVNLCSRVHGSQGSNRQQKLWIKKDCKNSVDKFFFFFIVQTGSFWCFREKYRKYRAWQQSLGHTL